MARIQLKIQGVADICSTHKASLIIITDLEEQHQISVVCDEVTRHGFIIRRGKYTDNKEHAAKVTETLAMALPETFSAIIKQITNIKLAVVILSIYDGQYQALIEDQITGQAFPIRISEGVLLCYADQSIPLFIEESLWLRQSVPYMGDQAQGVAMPLNTLNVEMLKQALQKSIDEEKYELAKLLKEEIDRRQK